MNSFSMRGFSSPRVPAREFTTLVAGIPSHQSVLNPCSHTREARTPLLVHPPQATHGRIPPPPPRLPRPPQVSPPGRRLFGCWLILAGLLIVLTLPESHPGVVRAINVARLIYCCVVGGPGPAGTAAIAAVLLVAGALPIYGGCGNV